MTAGADPVGGRTGIASRLLGLGRGRQAPVHRLPAPRIAGVYVDIENLRNAEHAREVIETVVRDWREDLPPPGRLYVYVPAQKAGLWDAWGTGIANLDVQVRPVQRFGRESSKNSADLAIVADAVADFATGAVSHVAVVSNDSDFGALYVKVRELSAARGETGQPPFLWINVAGRGSGLSDEIGAFIPASLRWVIPTAAATRAPPGGKRTGGAGKKAGSRQPASETIAGWLLDELPEHGRFRAEDVRRIIERRCSGHPAAQSTGVCGAFLARQLMPLLQDRGVKVVREKPRVYERG